MKQWCMCALIAASSLLADECNNVEGGYNLPAGVKLCGDCWELFGTIDFIYWQVKADGLQAALRNPGGDLGGDRILVPNPGGTFVEMEFDYKAGFKIGMGAVFNQGAWDTRAEYVRFRSQQHVQESEPNPPVGVLNGFWFDLNTLTADSKWDFSLDMIDWEIARSFYMGKRLIFRPHFGLRTAWIHQFLRVTGTGTVPSAFSEVSRNKGHSWGIGPRAGLDTDWMLGWGFRAIANASASVLWTDYENSVFITGTPFTSSFPPSSHMKSSFYVLRPNADVSLGAGWGWLSCCQKWHIDLAASYDFQIFWNQMGGTFTDIMDGLFYLSAAIDPIATITDLYIHGLTLSARLDF